MNENFKDKVAVVTGAGGVLCSEIAVRLAAEGARTVLVGRTEEKLQIVADKILAADGSCMVRAADVTDEAAVMELAEERGRFLNETAPLMTIFRFEQSMKKSCQVQAEAPFPAGKKRKLRLLILLCYYACSFSASQSEGTCSTVFSNSVTCFWIRLFSSWLAERPLYPAT